MEILIKPVNVNRELSNDMPTQYIAEHTGINFQTPFFGAELKVQSGSISVQATNPNDTLSSFTSFYFEDKYIGSSSFEKILLGKEFTIDIESAKYKGVFEDKKTILILE